MMEFSTFFVTACVSLLLIYEVGGSRIIMSGPQGPSHVMVQSAVASELIARGHEVYMAIGSRIDNPEMVERLGIKILYYHIPEDVIFGLTEDFNRAATDSLFNEGFPEYLASSTITRDCSLVIQA